jgi:hypothetical protein
MTDQDRDTDTGRGRGRQHYIFPVDSSSSHSTGSYESYAHRFNTYMALSPSQLVQDVQRVYEWKNADFYNMLVQQ